MIKDIKINIPDNYCMRVFNGQILFKCNFLYSLGIGDRNFCMIFGKLYKKRNINTLSSYQKCPSCKSEKVLTIPYV